MFQLREVPGSSPGQTRTTPSGDTFCYSDDGLSFYHHFTLLVDDLRLLAERVFLGSVFGQQKGRRPVVPSVV